MKNLTWQNPEQLFVAQDVKKYKLHWYCGIKDNFQCSEMNMEEIIYPASKQKFKVLVRCFTYNQSQYIEDALNGFAMQQTNFPFVCLVMDDCSTDGEQEVIKAYLDRECDMKRAEYFEDDTTTMTLVPHRTNVNCTFAVYLLKKNLYRVEEAKMVYVNPWREHCEYEALCEGDDYWTDPYKLQKQMDFLENHEAYAMCVNATKWQYSDGAITRGRGCQYITDSDISTDEIIRNGGLFLNTASYMYRASRIRKDEYAWWKMADVGDYPLCIAASLIGKVRFLSDEMSVYRFQIPGSWTGNQKGTVDLKHLQNEMTWLKCLDEETNGKYREAIYTHLFPGMIRGL